MTLRFRAAVILGLVSLVPFLGCDRAKPQGKVSPPSARQPAAAPARRREEPPPPPDKPNILLISLDTLRYDATGLAPQGTNPTPFLRQLAGNGVEFTHSYSTFDSTPESHFSMLTGFVSGWATQPFDVKEHSLAYQLSRDGYSTFGVVANGNLSRKFNQDVVAFDSYTCLADIWEGLSPEEKKRVLPPLDARIRHYGAPLNDFNEPALYMSADRVLARFAKNVAAAKPPFFGFLNFFDSHDPYFPDPAHYDADAEERDIRPRGFKSDLRTRTLPPEIVDPAKIADPKRRALVTDALKMVDSRAWSTAFDLDRDALEVYRKRYRAEVRELDDALRRIFDILAEKKLLDSTVVIITSDHGEAFGEKHLITHSFGNAGDREVTHRVPLVIVLPASYRVRNHAPGVETSSADVAPTIYDLVGLDWSKLSQKVLPGRYGKSLVPYFWAAAGSGRSRPIEANGAPLSEDEQAAIRRNAERRLRALGYLR
jgi:arylsulfatase A-like enzyme